MYLENATIFVLVEPVKKSKSRLRLTRTPYFGPDDYSTCGSS